jgi:hypothetical protein
MDLLDLPVFELRFPHDTQEKGKALSIEVDVTGDVSLKLPATKEVFDRAEHDFSLFWTGHEKRKLLEWMGKLFENWKNPLLLLTEWDRFSRLFKEEFNADLVSWTGALRQFFDDPVLFFEKQISLKDFVFLEVTTRFANCSRTCLCTKIDLTGDFANTVDPTAIGRHDIFGCHIKGVELAIFIKTVLRDFLLKIMKRSVVLL